MEYQRISGDLIHTDLDIDVQAEFLLKTTAEETSSYANKAELSGPTIFVMSVAQDAQNM